jgi:hypothetical protein
MTDLLLGPALGKLTAICADPRGWLVVWQEAGTLVLAQLHPNGQRRVPDTPIDCGGVPNSFPRVYRDARNASWLAYRENPSNLGRLLNLTTGQRYELGLVHGNYPIAFGDDCVVWHASETFQRKMAALTDPSRRLTMVGSFGAGTGLSHIAGGKVLGLDELRTSEPGMVNPQRAAGCVVGENADAGPDRNIARLEDGRECALWPGVASFMPQIAKRGSEISAEPETWAVATYGGPGPRLALLADADFALPKPPDPPPPVLPAKPLPGQTTEPTPPKEPAVKSREQFFAEFRAVNDFYAAPEGLQRPGGMVIGGQCDTEAMAAWGYNLMVGGTVEGIKAAIRTSEEWRIKHANDPVQPVPAFSGPIGVSAKDFVVP